MKKEMSRRLFRRSLVACNVLSKPEAIMTRNHRKPSNRFDDYEESYHDDFEYEVADDDCADDDAEDWSQEEEDENFDESETTLQYQYRRKPRGGRQNLSSARSVGGRENPERRKKKPPPSWVRPAARKPSPSSRSNRKCHDHLREPRDPCRDRCRERERERPNHGPHFWEKWLCRNQDRPEDDRSRERQRGTGNAAHRSDKACSNAPPEKNGSGWRRFLLLMVLLACGTAYTFHATLNVPREGNMHAPSHGEKEPSLPDASSGLLPDDDQQQAAGRKTPERGISERPDQRTETRQTGDTSRETRPQDTRNREEPPGLRTQERRTLQEQESEAHVASGLPRAFQQMSHSAETASKEELPSQGSPEERPL